jgi:hypothetical protein
MVYTVEMASHGVIYIHIVMKSGTGRQAISRFSFSNLNVCEVGITDGKEVYTHSALLRWAQVA